MKTSFLILILILILIPAHAATNFLNATVRPGYVYGANERPTTSTLNRLGNPTIEITGTIDGSAGIAAGTVTGTLLSDSLPGTNLTYDGSSPRKLVLKNSGVGSNQLDAVVFGFGLTGGGGAYAQVNIDSNSIVTTADGDGIQVTNLQPWRIAWMTNTIIAATPYGTNAAVALPAGWYVAGSSLIASNALGFTSNESNIVNGAICDVAHGLGVTPANVNWVFVCKTNDAGYAVGDELEMNQVTEADTSAVRFTHGANSTNVFCTAFSSVTASTLRLYTKSTGALDVMTAVKWRIKCYARP